VSPDIKIITDEPTLDDALDFKNYANTLANIILNSTPRFSVGIFGGWGTGKTSLMLMIKEILDRYENLVTVWFDAWRYEREENLAVIPFLRTLKLTLDALEKSKEGKWQGVKNGIKRSAIAFLTSTKLTYGVPGIGTAETDFGNVANTLRGDGSVGGDKNVIYYYVTQFLERALSELRKEEDHRIVVFIDDLDRCSPERALEVLESIKSFFDIEGIVYVVGMDSKSINSLVAKKFGQDSAVKGLDYLQKIVQLPFQIPTWREADISASIEKIILKGLGGSELIEQFTNNRELIVKAVELNPREVKRFINTIILVRSVFDKPIDELIAVQALNFRTDWNRFLELITLDDTRKRFLRIYKELRNSGKTIDNEADLVKFSNDKNLIVKPKEDFEINQEIFRHGTALTSFLDAGALDILLNIDRMAEHQRVLATAKVETEEEKLSEQQKLKELKEKLLNLLRDQKIAGFNAVRDKLPYPMQAYLDLSGVDLSNTILSGANLAGANLFGANLYSADLSGAILNGANLSNANLSFVDSFSDLECQKANFSGARITLERFGNYLRAHGAFNVSVFPL